MQQFFQKEGILFHTPNANFSKWKTFAIKKIFKSLIINELKH